MRPTRLIVIYGACFLIAFLFGILGDAAPDASLEKIVYFAIAASICAIVFLASLCSFIWSYIKRLKPT